MTPGDKLSDEQVVEARRLWADGKSLGTIATLIGCGVYDLSPWLYVPTIRDLLGESR